MRTLILLAATTLGVVAAEAQTSTYYAERGYWTVSSGVKFCRALNSPPEDFNYAPYNAFQIAVDGKGAISVDVFFWPGAVMTDRDYRLRLDFPTRKDPIILTARATFGDFVLASGTDLALWRALQDAPSVEVSVEGQELPRLRFGLNDSMWVLNALTTCARVLPKE
jgi:hypothetical protein